MERAGHATLVRIMSCKGIVTIDSAALDTQSGAPPSPRLSKGFGEGVLEALSVASPRCFRSRSQAPTRHEEDLGGRPSLFRREGEQLLIRGKAAVPEAAGQPAQYAAAM